MMSSWRDQILREFALRIARLTLVADPDGLLLEEIMLENLRERGFALIPFDDPIAFRYAYEATFRSRWDRGDAIDLVVMLRSPVNELGTLPYDLLQTGRKLSFSLGEIFPNLSYPVLAVLDRGDLDALYHAQQRYAPGPLGDNATKEFVVRHVFGIAPELLKQPADLLQMLLQRHYREQRLPALLDEWLIQQLRHNRAFADWPLERLVPDREAFFAFVQERWPLYLDHLAAQSDPTIQENRAAYIFTNTGPATLPFEHPDIRVYMNSLFLEGVFRPVTHAPAAILSKSWASIGIRTALPEEHSHRLKQLTENLSTTIPPIDARHGAWLHFARGWAELRLLSTERSELLTLTMQQALQDLQVRIDTQFTAWLIRRYAGLVNLPPAPPVMLHHLPRFFVRQFEEAPQIKVALLVIDGLALDQWLIMREVLTSQLPGVRLREQTLFAWIPTLTTVSRQAIFAGKPPLFFPNSLQTTAAEATLWKQFWTEQGFPTTQVVYLKGLGDADLMQVAEKIGHPNVRVAGLVVDKVDKIMHGMELGAAGMYNQVRQWSQQAYMTRLVELLLAQGFRIFLTSDHGNIEAEGCGSPAEGMVADLRGERARIYPNTVLRHQVKERFPAALEWEPIGLPETYLALLAPTRQAFIREGQHIVGHGGISLEEVVVPLVQIERGRV